VKLKESQESLIRTLLKERIREFVYDSATEYGVDSPEKFFKTGKLDESVESIIDFIKKHV
jgi:hypothetical protein